MGDNYLFASNQGTCKNKFRCVTWVYHGGASMEVRPTYCPACCSLNMSCRCRTSWSPFALIAQRPGCQCQPLCRPTSWVPNVFFCLFQHHFLQRPTSFLPNILLSKNTEGRYSSLPSRVFHITPFLAVQDSSIGDLVTQSVRPSEIFDNDNSRH